MKKTLITLMALAGVAMGSSLTNRQFDDGLAFFISQSGYSYGQTANWALTFTIDAVDTEQGLFTGVLVTLKPESYLIAQVPGHDDNAYVGLSKQISSMSGSWQTPSYTEGGQRTWEVDGLYDETWPDSWLSYNDSGDQTTLPLAGTTITLSSSVLATSMRIDYSNGTSSIINFTNDTMLDVKAVSLSNYITKIGNATLQVNDRMYTIPEPTTATLSLLALCGLAARRRRR